MRVHNSAQAPEARRGEAFSGRPTRRATEWNAPGNVARGWETESLLSLQRLAGNQAVCELLIRRRETGRTRPSPSYGGDRMIGLHPEGGHPLAAAMRGSDVRFRMPTFSDLKAVYTDKTLEIPESVIKDRVSRLLGRMKIENRLKSKDPVATIVRKIFPAPGVIDEGEFKSALDVADRSIIYQSVADAGTTVKPGDKAKLKIAMMDAAGIMAIAEKDAAGLTAVFGSKAALAKTNYMNAHKALRDVAADMDKKVSTDYNLDDPEVFLSGWADHGARHMHLLVGIVKVLDAKETKVTLIHEASHLSNSSVDDYGYYGSSGFEAMTEKEKVENAAHYEELPRRLLGISSYAEMTFEPGIKEGGGAITRDDIIHRDASEYCRQAWDAAVDTHGWLRGVRKAGLAGNTTLFTKDKALIREVSELIDLTVHEQDPAHATITALDVTLTESIARGASLVGDLVDAQPVPPPPMSNKHARDAVVASATAGYGGLLGDPVRDKALLKWFVNHYRALPNPP